MSKSRLIAVDMDGTLLMSDKKIHPDTARDVAYAAGRGIHVVYSTGRDISELEPYRAELAAIRYGICTSGAIVYDFEKKQTIHREAVPSGTIREALQIIGVRTGMAQFLGDGFSIVSEDQMEHMEDYHMGVYKDLYRRVAVTVPDMMAELDRHTSIPKMNIYFRSPQERDAARDKICHLPLQFATADLTSLEITAPGVSKARGLAELAAWLGLSLEETAGIGDADNDRELLETVGISVAMANASEDIRRICRLVTDDNDHNGAGKAIRLLAQ